MRSKIGLWGGSCAVRLPKMAVETLGFHEGETVDLQLENGALVIRPGRPAFDLSDLVREAKGLQAPESLDDEPQGSESL
ncbi:MAG: AbrB/MazE/SpoVT family DNA-binding domain-containing protein [Rhodospirillales bacterium]